MRKAQYSEALSDLNNALKSDDKNATHYIGRGLVYKKQEKYLEALQEFNKASEVEPKNYRANYQKASVYSLMNKIQETCDELEKAIDHGLSKWEGVKTAIQKNADFDNIRKAECWSKALSRI